MKIVLHLEVDEDELNINALELSNMSEDEKELQLTIALSQWIKEIDDWSQVWEFKES
ncbi:hypothetical protein KA005_27725 [bacterium]|nr:hypothetical protein [bacterium]